MAKQKRQEMWWVILAKSKTLRFFAVSCEFILFLGGLWITFTVNDPSAKTWLGGNVNMIFLTVMGWAIDAAMPEAWLHVVIQHVQKERGQLSWSKFVACCISVLFVGNIVYSIFTSGDMSKSTGTPTDATAWILLFLTILRITVGFVYLTVRQCQEWIKRDNESTAQPPALQSDYWPIVAMAAHLQSQFEAKLTGIQASFQKQLTDLASNQKTMLAEFQAIDISVPTVDYDALTQVVLTHLKADFDAWKQAQVDALPEPQQPQLDAPKPRQKHASKSQNDASNKILTMRQPSASTTDKKTRIHAFLDKDRSLTSYYLASQVGCSEATARRIKNEYIDAHSDASDAGQNDALETIVLTHDALRHDA